MKKVVGFIMCISMVFLVLCGCGKGKFAGKYYAIDDGYKFILDINSNGSGRLYIDGVESNGKDFTWEADEDSGKISLVYDNGKAEVYSFAESDGEIIAITTSSYCFVPLDD